MLKNFITVEFEKREKGCKKIRKDDFNLKIQMRIFNFNRR